MVKIYGHSDDSVCLDNSRYFEDEIECFDVAGVRLFLDDGTVLFVCYSFWCLAHFHRTKRLRTAPAQGLSGNK